MSEFGILTSKRKIGDFTAQVTVSEQHEDDLTVTDHPVERGAAITDHAFKNPARLVLVVGWSNSTKAALVSTIQTLFTGGLQAAASSDYVRTIYNKLLKLQADREPFTVTTGKRTYQNMLITSLSTTTDAATENSLIVTIQMREVIIVETQAVTVPPRDVQANPEQTAATSDTGTKQAVPAKSANKTALKGLLDGG